MTMLQEQAVQLIQDMSDDNVGFLIEVIQRLIPKKTYTLEQVKLLLEASKETRIHMQMVFALLMGLSQP